MKFDALLRITEFEVGALEEYDSVAG
jgi:hypothetical protein